MSELPHSISLVLALAAFSHAVPPRRDDHGRDGHRGGTGALGTVSRPTEFLVTGTEQMLAPGLEVAGVGPIGLPLPSVQAEQLVAAAERAPYGRRADSLTDITLRRTWQIDAGRVRIQSKYWPKTPRLLSPESPRALVSPIRSAPNSTKC